MSGLFQIEAYVDANEFGRANGLAVIKGFTCKERLEHGALGGIAVVAFVCAGAFSAGSTPIVLPIAQLTHLHRAAVSSADHPTHSSYPLRA